MLLPRSRYYLNKSYLPKVLNDLADCVAAAGSIHLRSPAIRLTLAQ